MEALRQRGELSPEQEVQLMKQQLEAVKQDCAKLANIQAENSRLKKELEALKGGQGGKGITAGKKVQLQLKAKFYTNLTNSRKTLNSEQYFIVFFKTTQRHNCF